MWTFDSYDNFNLLLQEFCDTLVVAQLAEVYTRFKHVLLDFRAELPLSSFRAFPDFPLLRQDHA